MRTVGNVDETHLQQVERLLWPASLPLKHRALHPNALRVCGSARTLEQLPSALQLIVLALKLDGSKPNLLAVLVRFERLNQNRTRALDITLRRGRGRGEERSRMVRTCTWRFRTKFFLIVPSLFSLHARPCLITMPSICQSSAFIQSKQRDTQRRTASHCCLAPMSHSTSAFGQYRTAFWSSCCSDSLRIGEGRTMGLW